jgi:hypothetical protein
MAAGMRNSGAMVSLTGSFQSIESTRKLQMPLSHESCINTCTHNNQPKTGSVDQKGESSIGTKLLKVQALATIQL